MEFGEYDGHRSIHGRWRGRTVLVAVLRDAMARQSQAGEISTSLEHELESMTTYIYVEYPITITVPWTLG